MRRLFVSSGGNVVVYILIREDQNEHGYIDTSITGVFHDRRLAREQETQERLRAQAKGLVVEDDECTDPDWQVSWAVEEHLVG